MIKAGGEAVVSYLIDRFTDHSQLLARALRDATERAWKVLELSLVGDSWWERARRLVAPAEERAFREQVQILLRGVVVPDPEFGRQCLSELADARRAGLLVPKAPAPEELASAAGELARFADVRGQLETELLVVEQLGGELKAVGFPSLARVVGLRVPERPLLAVAVRYFFRRAVVKDATLARTLAFARLEHLEEAGEAGFRNLAELLDGVRDVMLDTHAEVLDIKQTVLELLEHHRLAGREVRLSDSIVLSESERDLVRRLVRRFRALPDDHQRTAELVNDLAKAEHVVGDFGAATEHFHAAAAAATDTRTKAECHHNSYLAALEAGEWDQALASLLEAVRLDPARFEPFPTARFTPMRVIGIGGSGVAFLCRHTGREVVVKSLLTSELCRGVADVFAEAEATQSIDHPSVMRIREWGFADAEGERRPYLVLDYFDGSTLDEYVARHGVFGPEEALTVCGLVAGAVQAAHDREILHRDVKPGNILVRRTGAAWEVRLIDFGLAIRPALVCPGGVQPKSLSRRQLAIAGTREYAAPEQMGRLPGVAVGPYSDVYGFGRTCYFALLNTPEPGDDEKGRLPGGWRELLGGCTARLPESRPQSFQVVIERLGLIRGHPRQGLPAAVMPTAADISPPPSSRVAIVEQPAPPPPDVPAASGVNPPSGKPGLPAGDPCPAPEPNPPAEPETSQNGRLTFSQRVRVAEFRRNLDLQVERVDSNGIGRTREELLGIVPHDRQALTDRIREGLLRVLDARILRPEAGEIEAALRVLLDQFPGDRDAVHDRVVTGLRGFLEGCIKSRRAGVLAEAVRVMLAVRSEDRAALAADFAGGLQDTLGGRVAAADVQGVRDTVGAMHLLRPHEHVAQNQQLYDSLCSIVDAEAAKGHVTVVEEASEAALAIRPDERGALRDRALAGYGPALSKHSRGFRIDTVEAIAAAVERLDPGRMAELSELVYAGYLDVLDARAQSGNEAEAGKVVEALLALRPGERDALTARVYDVYGKTLDNVVMQGDVTRAEKLMAAMSELRPDDLVG